LEHADHRHPTSNFSVVTFNDIIINRQNKDTLSILIYDATHSPPPSNPWSKQGNTEFKHPLQDVRSPQASTLIEHDIAQHQVLSFVSQQLTPVVKQRHDPCWRLTSS
jgi:hypothetical protein